MLKKTDLGPYLTIILHWWWALLLVGILSGGLTFFVSSRQQPIYQASTTILIDEAPGAKGNSDYQSILTSERRASTYSQLLTTEPLLQSVIQKLGLSYGTTKLKSAITARSVRDTTLIKVDVRDTDPPRAARIANTLVQTFAEQNSTLQTSRYAASKESLKQQMAVLEQQIQQADAGLAALGQGANDKAERDRLGTALAQYRQSYANLLQSYEQVRLAEAQGNSNIVQVEPAVVPARPIAPRVVLNTVLGDLTGLLIALSLIFFREALDATLKDPEQITAQLGLPILGFVARMKSSERATPIVVAQPRSPVTEAFRGLRTNLQFSSVDRQLRTLLVTSSDPDEGKSTITANLGAVIAQSGLRVTLVDADLRRPRLHKFFQIANRLGLSELFVRPETAPVEVVQATSVPGVSVLTAGTIPPNPAELLGSEKMVNILNEIRDQADFVLIDAPPISPVTDAVVLAQRADGVLLIVRAGETKITAAKQALEQLGRAGARLIGVVINDIPLSRSRYRYAYQVYYRSYQYNDQAATNGASRSGRRKWWWRRGKRTVRSASATTRDASSIVTE